MKLKETVVFALITLCLVSCRLLNGVPIESATPTLPALTPPPTRFSGLAAESTPFAETPIPETALPDQTTVSEWTILLYMDADNNLESYGVSDLAELSSGGVGLTDVQLAVQIDRAQGYDDGDGNWTEARRYGLVGQSLEQVESLGEVNMADGATLSEFLNWGIEAYPARKYALIMWGHGVGWQGITYDESASSARMSSNELGNAIRKGLDSAEIDKLDLIGFDACLMAQLDVFNAVAPVADYAVASQELIPARGWNYSDILSQMQGENAFGDGRWLSNLIVGSYQDSYSGQFNSLTLSAVETDKMAALNASVGALGGILANDADVYATTLSNARGGGVTFASVFPQQQDQYASIDLGRFASLVSQLAPLNPAVAASQEVLRRLDAALVSSTRGSDMPLASGVATYFPRFGRFYDASYAQLTTNPAWNAMLQAYYAIDIAPVQIAVTSTGDQTEISKADPALLRFYVTGRLIEEVSFWAGAQQGDGSVQLFEHDRLLPEPSDLPDGTVLEKWRDGFHNDFLIWDATATKLRDGNSAEFVIMWPVAGSSSRFAVQGDYYAVGRQQALAANLIFDHSTRQLVAVWGGDSASPSEIEPQVGDMFVAYDWFLEDETELVARPGTRFDVLSLSYDWEPLAAGDYAVGFQAETAGGALAQDWRSVVVEQATDAALASYVDPYLGFQFSYPTTWANPRYGDFSDSLLYTSNLSGTQSFQLKLFDEEGISAESIKQSILEEWSNVTTLWEEVGFVGEHLAQRTTYGYMAVDGERRGALLTFVDDKTGYALDLDFPAEDEVELLSTFEQISESWRQRDLGIGTTPEQFATLTRASDGRIVPLDFTEEPLANGWTRYTSGPEPRTFVAQRRDESLGRDAAAVAVRWLDEASDGIGRFEKEPPARIVISNQVWTATRFDYVVGDGDPMRGLMLTAVDEAERVVWAEAPRSDWDIFELELFAWISAEYAR